MKQNTMLLSEYVDQNMKQVSMPVLHNIMIYLEENLPEYELGDIIRYSAKESDNYLYMIYAKKKMKDEYAVWLCWNESTKVLNHGIYGITSEEKCFELLKEHYKKHTF